MSNVQLLIRNHLGGYEYANRGSWFKSSDYLDFVDHWRNLCHLLDCIIDEGELDLRYLSWFRDSAMKWKRPRENNPTDREGYMLSVGLRDSKGKLVTPQSMIGKGINTVLLDQWKVEETHTVEERRYGLRIGFMLYQIHRRLIRAMENPEENAIRKCKYPYCGNIFRPSRQGLYKHVFCDDNCCKREKKRPYYECLVAYLTEWLQTHGELERPYTAKALSESFGQYVCEKHDPDFSLKPRQVGVEFREENFNRYLERHDFRCKQEGERRPYHYVFERFNEE